MLPWLVSMWMLNFCPFLSLEIKQPSITWKEVGRIESKYFLEKRNTVWCCETQLRSLTHWCTIWTESSKQKQCVFWNCCECVPWPAHRTGRHRDSGKHQSQKQNTCKINIMSKLILLWCDKYTTQKLNNRKHRSQMIRISFMVTPAMTYAHFWPSHRVQVHTVNVVFPGFL